MCTNKKRSRKGNKQVIAGGSRTENISRFCFWYGKRRVLVRGLLVENSDNGGESEDCHNGDPVEFLDTIKKQFPELHMQAIPTSFIISKEHIQKIMTISIFSESTGNMLADRVETDLLMRFALTDQIKEAIKKVGLKREKSTPFALIVIAKKESGERGANSALKLERYLHRFPKANLVSNKERRKKEYHMKKMFEITTKQLQCTVSKTPLEDILAEKAACLLR